MPLEYPFERRALVPAKHLLAEQLEQLAERDAALLLDLAVELDEGHAKARRERAAERRFAGPAQADQRHAMSAHVARCAGKSRQQQIARRGEIDGSEPVEELPEQARIHGAVGPFVDQFGERHADRVGDAAQQQNRKIALAGFELRQIALGDFRMLGEQLARHSAAAAHHAHPGADAIEKRRQILGRSGPRRRPALGFGAGFGHGPFHGLHYNASRP